MSLISMSVNHTIHIDLLISTEIVDNEITILVCSLVIFEPRIRCNTYIPTIINHLLHFPILIIDFTIQLSAELLSLSLVLLLSLFVLKMYHIIFFLLDFYLFFQTLYTFVNSRMQFWLYFDILFFPDILQISFNNLFPQIYMLSKLFLFLDLLLNIFLEVGFLYSTDFFQILPSLLYFIILKVYFISELVRSSRMLQTIIRWF